MLRAERRAVRSCIQWQPYRQVSAREAHHRKKSRGECAQEDSGLERLQPTQPARAVDDSSGERGPHAYLLVSLRGERREPLSAPPPCGGLPPE